MKSFQLHKNGWNLENNSFIEIMGCLFFFTSKLQEKDFKTKNKNGGPPTFTKLCLLIS